MKVIQSLTMILLFAGVVSPGRAQVVETPVTIGLVQGGNPQGYIKGSNAQGVLFATAPGGQGQMITYDRIRGEGLEKAIRFEERVEVLGAPRALFSEENYEEAARAFGMVARNYEIIMAVPENFALEAFFYGAESLRRAGNYEALAAALELPPAATIETLLGERYQKSYQYLKLWGLYGGGKMDELETALATYQEPVVGNAKLLSTANFRKLPGAEVAQLAYLRAKVVESKGDANPALDDYYRAFTLAYGNDDRLARKAMLAALDIHAKDPSLEKDGSPVQSQVQALAYLFSQKYDEAELPEALQKFARRPATNPIPRPAPAGEGASGDAAAGEGMPAEGEETKAGAKAKGKKKG